jgi:thiol-disulfide isomerase/thioredoxin
MASLARALLTATRATSSRVSTSGARRFGTAAAAYVTLDESKTKLSELTAAPGAKVIAVRALACLRLIACRDWPRRPSSRPPACPFSHRPFLQYFGATWCGPCKVIGPAFVEVAEKRGPEGVTFVKIDVDDNSATAEEVRGAVWQASWRRLSGRLSCAAPTSPASSTLGTHAQNPLAFIQSVPRRRASARCPPSWPFPAARR